MYRYEIFNPATGIALRQFLTRAGAWAAIRRAGYATPLSVRPIV